MNPTVLRAVLLSPRRNPFTAAVQAIFSDGRQGFWYDFWDRTALSQDTAGASPVTATGDPIGRVRDKSGRGNHIVQATAAARPLWQRDANGKTHGEFDGIDGSMATAAAVNFSGGDEVTVSCGVTKLSDAASGMVVELTASVATEVGSFNLYAPLLSTNGYRFASRGDGSSSNAGAGAADYAAPSTNVVTGTGDISGDATTLRVNGTQIATASTDQGAGNFSNATLYVGRRGGSSLPLNGRIYSLIGCAGLLTAGQIATVEAYINYQTGAY